MKNKNLSFKDRIVELRTEYGLSQQDLARAINFGKSIIYYWENGEREPNTKALIALSNYFNVSIEYLLGISDEEKIYSDYSARLTDKEKRLLKAFMQLDDVAQEKLLGDAEFYANHAGSATRSATKRA